MSEPVSVTSILVGPYATNTWVVDAGDGAAVIVDPGAEPDAILAAVDRMGLKVAAILVTHTHIDHVAAVAALVRTTGAPVYCSAIEAETLARLNEAVAGERIPRSLRPVAGHDPEVELHGEETLTLNALQITAILTPGHSPGHLIYVSEPRDIAFTGDLFLAAKTAAEVPHSDVVLARRVREGLIRRLRPSTRLLPGHGPESVLADWA